MKTLKKAIKTLDKTAYTLKEDVNAINLQIRILLNRKAEIIKNEKLINKVIPMSKYRYSRMYLKAIINLFPQLTTPSEINAALCMVRGLSVEAMAKELNLSHSAVRSRRKQVLTKTNQESHSSMCAYFVNYSQGIID